jgi:hypothetical protein
VALKEAQARIKINKLLGVTFIHLNQELYHLIPEYIKDNINLAEFSK